MPERKTDYEREENMVDALDNCDDPVIHIATVMKLLWLILTMLVTIDLLSIFRLTPHHCDLIAGHLVLIVI